MTSSPKRRIESDVMKLYVIPYTGESTNLNSLMSDYEVTLVNDNMYAFFHMVSGLMNRQEFYVRFHGPNESITLTLIDRTKNSTLRWRSLESSC